MKKTGTTGTVIKNPPYHNTTQEQEFDIKRAEKLQELLSDAFGERRGSIKTASAALEVNYNNLRGMLKGRKSIPDWLFNTLSEIAADKKPPTPPVGELANEERTASAIGPYISGLIVKFCSAGWDRDKIILSLVNWSLNDVQENHGKLAVTALLRSALSIAEEGKN